MPEEDQGDEDRGEVVLAVRGLNLVWLPASHDGVNPRPLKTLAPRPPDPQTSLSSSQSRHGQRQSLVGSSSGPSWVMVIPDHTLATMVGVSYSPL
ncbi:hypothetical protein PR202_gb29305 [Eleusine coracana subsp. coracana]|uniref:Uncharacterized protein n=1 Tax=Eleusine coracana subsp. coracana TaxID=191504 RepID=A0AAV5FZB9_ELECO|nr:hypothetical protein PR202_gb29305 [Eleusine coracana subsp. coracana]